MSDRAYITRLREEVATRIRDLIASTDLTVKTSLMPRSQTGNKVTPDQPDGKPVCWVLERGFRSSIETRKSVELQLDVDVALYSPARSDDGDTERDAAGVEHFGMFDRIVAALQLVGFTLPAGAASSEVDVDTRFISIEVNRQLDGPSLEQRDQLVSVLTLTHAASITAPST
jgi:hypothetical protein